MPDSPGDAAAQGHDEGCLGGERLGRAALLLYLGWIGVGWLAHAVGDSRLDPLAGLLLLGGALLTNLLFGTVFRRADGEVRESAGTFATVHAIMGIIWATLYAHFSRGGSGLALGMMLCAVALPALFGERGALLRLAAFGWLAYAGVTALKLLPPAEFGAGTWLQLVAVATLALAALLVYAAVIEEQQRAARLSRERLLYALREARHHAERDQLTHSYSRRYIMDMLAREKGRADRSGDRFSICLLDIDHFKAVNDLYGHQTGDRILATFVRRVRRELRTMDSVNGGALPRALGRFGGEEFLVILPGTGLQGALRCAERMRQSVVSRPFNGLHQVTASIGIAEYQTGETLEQLLRRCDEALYAAKRAGRNRVTCSTGPGKPDTVVMPDLRSSL